MNNYFIIESGINILVTVLFGCLFIAIIVFLFRHKHYTGGAPNNAQAVLLSGRIIAGVILLTGINTPLKEYLLISNSGPLEGSVWIFRIICLVAVCISYFIAMALEEVFYRLIFPGLTLDTTLNEDNVVAGLIRAIIIVCFSVILLLSIGILLPLLIPAPQLHGING